MKHVRISSRLVALAVVTLVGAGACTFDPQADGGGGGGPVAAGAAERVTGASGAPGPDQRARPSTAPPKPKVKPTRGTPAPTRPTVKPTRPATRPTTSPSAAGCPQGEHQRAVEAYLARLGGFGRVTVDGRQSAADCAAIKKFQKRYDIRPAHGRAGPTTHDVAKRLATTDTARCRAGSGTTFCIDLTRQTTWVMRNGRVLVKPTVTRTGMPGYRTPAGTFTINYRNVKEWSDPYEVWLPYWQHFTRGMGFHQTTTYLHEKSIGSHGCVNLLPGDAVRFWELGKVGSKVVLVGRRPGT
ncbi:Putative peptidoglycan binding domain-containing protein [Micromonospora echinofusca]|uniref:Putative peptidoglycan binding domain-containing protein n=1 Tax=Micromonospora echinofusca TaxID=47858 RepID=A0A1C5GG41_MICEH|nr:L,D-transpeptidase family protein [Micromonospora echinofusca]SCG18771.1 Putative peptidoglycan binding domain-containing protein [Micromonospora echinofusca]